MSGDYLTGNSRCPICSGHHPINAPCFLSTNWIPLEKTPMTPDIKELVRRLRTFKHRDANAAADALEAMAGEVERVKSQRDEYLQFWKNNAEACEAAEAERDRLKEAIERNAQNCIDTMNKMHAQHAAERDRLAGEVERLKDQNTAWADKYGDTQNAMYAALDERDRLKGVLEPFAKLSTDRERQDPPEGTMRVRVVTAPEIEAARKALGGDA